VRQVLGSRLEKLHGSTGKLSRGSGEARCLQEWLAAVAGARVAWAGDAELAGAKSWVWEVRRGVEGVRPRPHYFIGVGARARTARHERVCTGASAAVEHVAHRFCSCSNADRSHIFVNLGKITV
jgi:hypothetical protein